MDQGSNGFVVAKVRTPAAGGEVRWRSIADVDIYFRLFAQSSRNHHPPIPPLIATCREILTSMRKGELFPYPPPVLVAKRSSEVETNIQNVNNLLGSHSRISGASDPSAIAETIEELQATLNLLETDLQDLEDCVQVVEGHGDRWGIEASEVRQRRSFVDRVTRDVEVRGTGAVRLKCANPSSAFAQEFEMWSVRGRNGISRPSRPPTLKTNEQVPMPRKSRDGSERNNRWASAP